MDFICPVCNGIENIYMECPQCNKEMQEAGNLQQFFDPYNPYISPELMELEGVTESKCIHVVFCNKCGKDTRVSIDKVNW